MSRFIHASSLFLAACAFLLSAGCGQAASNPKRVDPAVLAEQISANGEGSAALPLIIDVRTPGEYAAGHVPGAINISHEQMPARFSEIAMHKGGPVVLYCRSGRRSGLAAKVLAEHGFKDIGLLEGDMPGWERDGYPVVRGEGNEK